MLQIGPDIVKEMSDEDMIELGINRFGDRVAIRTYVRAAAPHEDPVAGPSGLPSRLVNVIKNKAKPTEPANSMQIRRRKLAGNKNAKKTYKSFEMGWLMDNGGQVKQVRQRKGGGTRKLIAFLTATLAEVLESAVGLFFPDGVSKLGNVTEFRFKLCLFDETVIKDLDQTVNDIIMTTKMPNLRLYLLSKKDNFPSSPGRDSVSSPITASDIASSPVHDIVTGISSVDDEIMFHPSQTDMEAMQDDLDVTLAIEICDIHLHRGNVLNDLESYIIEHNLDIRSQKPYITMISPNGRTEIAADGGGVLRDALSEYWDTFYERRTVGNIMKVPCLSHDVGREKWAAAATILKMGYYFEGYFPVQLTPSFLEYVLTGDVLEKRELIVEYLLFLPDSEKKLIEEALVNFDAVSQEDLLELLHDHGVRCIPSKKNFSSLIEEMAHKELLQEPSYVADCWKNEVTDLKKLMQKTFLELRNDLDPNFRAVWGCVQIDSPSDTAQYLKRFLKEASKKTLKNFLRFCTGKLNCSLCCMTCIHHTEIPCRCRCLLEENHPS